MLTLSEKRKTQKKVKNLREDLMRDAVLLSFLRFLAADVSWGDVCLVFMCLVALIISYKY